MLNTDVSYYSTYYIFQLLFCHDSSDPILMAEAKWKNVHNHKVNCAASAQFRDVSQDVRDKFIAYFGRGLIPSIALKEHQEELRKEYSAKDYHMIQGDRYYCPDIAWVRR